MKGRFRSMSPTKTILLAMLVLGLWQSPASSNCPYGDTSYVDGSTIKASDQIYVCAFGQWFRDKDIASVINVEQANLWANCCGSADLTTYAKTVCNERQECSIPPANGWAGKNPDQNNQKHLWVRYHCERPTGDIAVSHYTKQAEENTPLNISCKLF